MLEEIRRVILETLDLDRLVRITTEEMALVKEYIIRNAPVDSGTMRRHIASSVPEVRVEGFYLVGRLPAPPGLGTPYEAAPRGTIREFLRDFPQYRRREGGVPRNMAWIMLSREGKAELRRQRRAGRYGGETSYAVGRAPYFWVVAAHTLPGKTSAIKAGLSGRRGFMEGIEEAAAGLLAERVFRRYAEET